MIDIENIKYDTILLLPDGTAIDITEILLSCSWSENQGELAKSLNIELKNTAYEGTFISELAVPGTQLFIYSNWGGGRQEIFRGPIWEYEYASATRKILTLTAYDNAIYMKKSKDYKWFASGTSSKTMILEIIDDWGIPVERYQGPDVALGKKVFKGMYIADMIYEILDDAKKKGKGIFTVRVNQGKIEIVPRGCNEEVYVFDADNTVMTTEKMSLSELVTRVKVIGIEDKAERSPMEAVIDGNTQFGILQDIIQRSQDQSIADAKASATVIIDEKGTPMFTRTLQTPDIPFIRKGDKVKIKAGSLYGYYYVTSVQHDISNRTMTMEVMC